MSRTIRRYPDLLVHRAIKHALSGKPLDKFTYNPREMAALALQCSERERRAGGLCAAPQPVQQHGRVDTAAVTHQQRRIQRNEGR
ncbi:hypothetical protein, partial [Stenotrophomonas sp. 3diitr2024]|uniref:hypothetical protein n=1 Tax=Stenotrophomonas sp. 3diitr2024 TaxID=3345115 RepID=UPI0035CA0317